MKLSIKSLTFSFMQTTIFQLLLHSTEAFQTGGARPSGEKANVFSFRRLTQNGDELNDLVVATYNLWNIMFHWEVRKLYIADMIDTHDIDVIGFQEVRADKDNSHNQLHDLQELLPKHKSLIYHPTRRINQKPEQRPPGWELEGIGILSKHNILSYHVKNLTIGSGVDQTQRAVVSAQILVNGHEVSLIVTHFSYDRESQCQNAWHILKYIHTARADKMVLMGDFNTYNEYHWPIELLLTGNIDIQAPAECHMVQKPWFHGHPDFEFVDAWTELNTHSPGFTFSNMPDPGLHSRPDRILLSKHLFKVDSVFKIGGGWGYRREYTETLHLARLHAVYESANKQVNGHLYESSCLWDCGPHGICRCGICVSKQEDDCDESYCSVCGPARLRYYQFLQGLFFALLALFLFGLGICISRPIAITFRSKSCPKLQRSIFTNKYFLLLTAVGMLAVYLIFKLNYSDVMELVDSQIAEELYPSDHLMVVARLSIE